MLGLAFVALGVVTDTGYGLAGSRVGDRVSRDRRQLPVGRYVAGGTDIALGLLAAVSGSSSRPVPTAAPRGR